MLNARFQPTRFREGYDQDEVDDFLAQLEHGFLSLAGRGADAPIGNAGPAPVSGGPLPTYDVSDTSSPNQRPGEYSTQKQPTIALVLVVAAAVGAVALMVWMFAL